MIEAMRTMALDYLVGELSGEAMPTDIEGWYKELRKNAPGKLFPYLVEDTGAIEKVYILEKYAEGPVHLSVQDIVNNNSGNGCTPDKLPFMRPAGSQSAQVGPVFKRSYDKAKGGGPSAKILATTVNHFAGIAGTDKTWAHYFKDILNILDSTNLRLPNGEVINWQESGYANMLACAVDKIGLQNGTVFLIVRDSQGLLPGENSFYVDYLLTEKLAGDRYATLQATAKENESCSLCNTSEITVYPNALKGAGINLSNVDRVGTFPGVDTDQAWKKYALCSACADLLYIYKFHVLKKVGPQKNLPFSAKVAGDTALIIPSFFPGLPIEARLEVLEEAKSYIANMSTDIEQDEKNLLYLLKDKETILNLVMLWADIGQEIGNISGIITNVLPSRLKDLSELNDRSLDWKHPLFPKFFLDSKQAYFKPDLSLKTLRPLFYRPGGKKADDANKSKQLFQLKRQLAECIYYQKLLPGDYSQRFWDELMVTARWYWLEALDQKDGHRGLIYEGTGKKGPYLTAAGWVRHLSWWLYYFKQAGVLEMEKEFFKPSMEGLKLYFGPESRINTQEKAFAFLLGVLYGKLLQVQGAKGINVSANALSWLKRLTLKGKDLPELYIKVRGKLLAYETEKNEKVRALISEIGHLGIKLGDRIELDETQTNYFLLLGQSVAVEILPSEEKNKGSEKNNER